MQGHNQSHRIARDHLLKQRAVSIMLAAFFLFAFEFVIEYFYALVVLCGLTKKQRATSQEEIIFVLTPPVV